MSEEEINRKIAVIFATDVVGYSKSIENNETQTLKNLKECRNILDNLITLSSKNLLFLAFKWKDISCLNFKILMPIKYAGTIPTSDKTEYLPPI